MRCTEKLGDGVVEVLSELCAFEERVGRDEDDDTDDHAFDVGHGVLIVNNTYDVSIYLFGQLGRVTLNEQKHNQEFLCIFSQLFRKLVSSSWMLLLVLFEISA